MAVASSAKKDELANYLDIARIAGLVDVTTSSDDVKESKPAPDIFEVVLGKFKIEGGDAVTIGDTPYDAAAAGRQRSRPSASFAKSQNLAPRRRFGTHSSFLV